MTSHPDTSPPEPLTIDAVVRMIEPHKLTGDNAAVMIDAGKLRRAVAALRALELHAEAMAQAIGREKVNSMPRDVAIAFAEYRIAFPRPRAEKDATHG